MSRTMSDEGYKAWVERKRAEPAVEKKPISEARRVALEQARAKKAYKLLKHLPATEFF